MIKFLADQNFNAKIVRGVLLRDRSIDMVRLETTEMNGAGDPKILAFAAREGRVVVTHDRNTMSGFAFDRVERGDDMPGVIIVDDRSGIGGAIDDQPLIAACTPDEELVNSIIWVPSN